MKYFKASGLWFPSDEPENRVAGTLRFSKSGLRLMLLGGFQGGWSPDVQAYGVIHGVVGDSPYGEFVTLHDGFQVSKSVRSQGIGAEVIRCRRAYMGGDYLIDEGAEVDAISLTTTFMYDWARVPGANHFEVSHPSTTNVTVQYDFPAPARFEIDDAALLVGFGCSSRSGARSASILASSSMSITPSKPLGAGAITGRFMQRFCDLVSFATDRPNAIEEVSLTRRRPVGVSEKFHLLYDRIFISKGVTGGLYEGDMLFSLPEATKAGLNVFQSWLDFTRRFAPFCTAYFSNFYAQPRYLDEKFQRLMSAFTLLCGSLGVEAPAAERFIEDVGRAVHAHFTVGEREALSHLIPTYAQVSLALGLRRLLEENSRLMGQVITDFDRFVEAVSNTLRHIETRESPGDRPFFDGPELYYALQKVRLLIKILVLGLLGFGAAQVGSLIERNKEFLHLRTLADRPLPPGRRP